MIAVITNLALLGCALVFLLHFGMIAYYGKVEIGEPDPVILAWEICMMVMFAGLAVHNLIKLYRR